MNSTMFHISYEGAGIDTSPKADNRRRAVALLGFAMAPFTLGMSLAITCMAINQMEAAEFARK